MSISSKTYLDFKFIGELPKTKVYEVVNKLNGTALGEIRWYGPWRKYTLQPYSDTVWHTGCLNEVHRFIEKLMAERKVA